MRPQRFIAGVVAVVVLAVLAGSTSSVAAGATRWAAPTAQGVGDCSSEANACTLEQAVSGGAGGAVAGDEVILRSDLGVFNLSSTLSLTMALQIHGKDGAPRPTIRLTDPTANPTIQPNNNSTLRHLRIERDGGDVGSAGVILTANDAVEDVEVVSSGTTQLGIYATAPVTIRDSTVWDTGSRIGAAIVLDDPSSGAVASQIRNVTAVGTGNNSGIQANTFGASGHHIWAVIKNAIAKGGGANPDVSVNTPGSTAKLDMYNSNFATASPAPVACNSAGTVAIRDCGNNQRASSPPLLANLSTGDFRELAGSPTIDAGIDDGQLGPADPDGHPRSLGTAPDLGAYEYVSQQTLTVSKAGSGQGTVASSAAGIDCGSACQHTYDQGTAITLTATPAADSRS